MQKSMNGFQQVGDDEGVAWSLDTLAHIFKMNGDVQKSDVLLAQARDLFLKIGDLVLALECTNALSENEWRRGNIKTAQKNYEASLLVARDLGLDDHSKDILALLGDTTTMQGNYELAARRYEEAEVYSKKAGDQSWDKILFLLSRGDLAFMMGDLENACHFFESALDGIKKNQSDEFSGNTLKMYGFVLLITGRYEEARLYFEKSIAQMEKVGQERYAEMSWLGLGELERLAGNFPLAARHYQQALFLRNKYQRYLYTPELFDGFAKLSLMQRYLIQAARWFGIADSLRKEFGIVLPPVFRPDHDKHVELLKGQMSAEEFASAWTEGANTDLKDAVALALQGYEPEFDKPK
jgi:tetratricopeptide (TPR) repeat protein